MNAKNLLGFWTLATLLLAASVPSPANNLVVANTVLRAPADGKVQVGFDISWDNAWRDGVNWDAAWVFVKYSVDGGTNWSHATLAASGTNPSGFDAGTGTNLEIVVPADKKGAFIQRAVTGAGSVSNTGVKLIWDFAADGVSRSKSALIKVFAIEMVYVPEGSFAAGSGGSGVSEFTLTTIHTNNASVAPSGTGSLGGQGGGYPTGQTAPNALWPNGYPAFYLMKTEQSQRQYCDFLNTLTAAQQDNRHDSGLNFNSMRNYIKKTATRPAFFGCDANGNAGPVAAATATLLNEADDGEWVACNYISWMDVAAYADWAALRPFTELEFEKACRGTCPPLADEYAWGDTLMMAATTALGNPKTAAETPNQGNCNFTDCALDAPYRVGSYAQAGSSRVQAGAGYYGALNLSDNLQERTVTIGNAAGRSFTGVHGDGLLSAAGHANEMNWPGWVVGQVTGAEGIGSRGGGHNFTAGYSRVSDRSKSNDGDLRRHGSIGGGRCARTAP